MPDTWGMDTTTRIRTTILSALMAGALFIALATIAAANTITASSGRTEIRSYPGTTPVHLAAVNRVQSYGKG